jgi:ribokinase
MIAVIGSTNIDIVYEVDHFTKPGETQTALSLNYYFGGKGANQAVAAAKIGQQPVYFSSSVGDDSQCIEMINNFKKLEIVGYQVHEETKTGRAFIEVDANGENRIVITPGANDLHSPELIETFLNQYGSEIDFCLIQNEIPGNSIKKALELLKEKNIKIIYDPAPKEKTELDWLQDIDYLTPNETEFRYLAEKLNIDKENLSDKAVEFKSKTKLNTLIIKRGDKELLILNEEDQIIKQKPFKVQAVDTTAAGDIFNAGLAVALNMELKLERACHYAAAAAAVSVTKRGAQSSIPKPAEIADMINKK